MGDYNDSFGNKVNNPSTHYGKMQNSLGQPVSRPETFIEKNIREDGERRKQNQKGHHGAADYTSLKITLVVLALLGLLYLGVEIYEYFQPPWWQFKK